MLLMVRKLVAFLRTEFYFERPLEGQWGFWKDRIDERRTFYGFGVVIVAKVKYDP